MNLEYAVDRLYEAGWTPHGEPDIETLANGRAFPSLDAIRREFADAGFSLSIAHNAQFNCYRATWSSRIEPDRADFSSTGRMNQATVIGTSEREAAVYALAMLRAAEANRPTRELAEV